MSALKNAVGSGALVRVRRGIYATSLDDPRIAALAAARRYPHRAVSDRSAVLLHGLPLLGSQPPLPELTVPPRANANLTGIHPYRAELREQDVVTIDGALVTSPSRTLIDLARHRARTTAIVAIDAALNRGVTSFEELADVLDFCRNWPGAPRARRAVGLANGLAESPLESMSRLVMPTLGVPTPQLQTELFDLRRRLLGRVDFYWDEFGVAGEADGRGKYLDHAVLLREKQRQERLEDAGLVVVRWQWEHVTTQRAELASKIAAACQRGRRRDDAGMPRLWRS